MVLKENGYIDFDKVEKNEFHSLYVYNLRLLDKGYNYLRDKKINSKKWNNEHDKILYGFMEYLSNTNKDIICFSDFDLGNKRPDILTTNKTKILEKINPTIYEIKHSRIIYFCPVLFTYQGLGKSTVYQ